MLMRILFPKPGCVCVCVGAHSLSLLWYTVFRSGRAGVQQKRAEESPVYSLPINRSRDSCFDVSESWDVHCTQKLGGPGGEKVKNKWLKSYGNWKENNQCLCREKQQMWPVRAWGRDHNQTRRESQWREEWGDDVPGFSSPTTLSNMPRP